MVKAGKYGRAWTAVRSADGPTLSRQWTHHAHRQPAHGSHFETTAFYGPPWYLRYESTIQHYTLPVAYAPSRYDRELRH
jgi:hypothetical protein